MVSESAKAVQMAVQALNQGNAHTAGRILEQALARDPKHPDLLHLSGYLRLGYGQLEEGIALIKEAIRLAPKVALFHYNLGNAYFKQQANQKALESFQNAVRNDPRFKDAVDNLAIVKAEMKKLREAEVLFERSLQLAPKDPKAHLNLAKVRMELRKPELVEESIVKATALGQMEKNADFWLEVGQIYQGIGWLKQATDSFRKGLALDSEKMLLHLALCKVLSESDDYEGAESALQKALTLEVDCPDARIELANVYISSGRVDQGREILQEQVTRSQDNENLLLRAAEIFSLIGDFDNQERILLRIQEINPENIAVQAHLAFVPKRKLDERDVTKLEKRIDDESVDPGVRCTIGFALGNHYRNVKEYDKAFNFYKTGNQLKGYRWDRTRYRQWVNETCEIYTKEFYAERAGWGSDSRLPILIVGMPRSGTTLTEQILSSHSDVHGAGEFGSVAGLCAGEEVPQLPITEDAASVLSVDAQQARKMAENHLQRMRGQATHGEHFVTNKLPQNFQQVGLFGLLFPKAPVIHIQRDPRDNLLSIYFQNFSGYHPYAYDLKNLAFQYWEQERLMRHWKSVVPNPVFDLKYEELVADLPGTIQRLADFVGIDVEESMQRFYEQEREVKTASKWQVRQKLYNTSVARWKPYEKHFAPMFAALEQYAL